MMSAAPPNRRCQRPWLITITSLVPPAVSAGEKVRPSIACARVTSKRFGVADPPRISSGSASAGEAGVVFLVAGDVDEALRLARIRIDLAQREVRGLRAIRLPRSPSAGPASP